MPETGYSLHFFQLCNVEFYHIFVGKTGSERCIYFLMVPMLLVIKLMRAISGLPTGSHGEVYASHLVTPQYKALLV